MWTPPDPDEPAIVRVVPPRRRPSQVREALDALNRPGQVREALDALDGNHPPPDAADPVIPNYAQRRLSLRPVRAWLWQVTTAVIVAVIAAVIVAGITGHL